MFSDFSDWLLTWGSDGVSPEIGFHSFITITLVILVWGSYVVRCWIGAKREKREAGPMAEFMEASSFSAVALIRRLLVAVFLSLVLLFFLMARRAAEHSSGFAMLVDCVIRAAQALSLGVSPQDMWEYAEDIGMQLLSFDQTWIALMVGVAPVLSISTAATLFRIPRFQFLLRFSRRQICIFSALNDRATKYAKAVQKANPGNAPYIVFCAEGSEDKSDAANGVDQSLVLKNGVCSLRLPRRALRRISFYLIDDDRSIIIEQALRLQDKYLNCGCHIFCVSGGNLNEHAVDQMNRAADLAHQRAMKAGHRSIRFDRNEQVNIRSRSQAKTVQTSFVDVINEAARVIYHNLYDGSSLLLNQDFLSKVMPTEGELTVRVLVLGAGTLGEEIARTLLWYCQLPNTRVRVTIAGQEEERVIRSRVYRKNQRFEELLNKIGYGQRAALDVRGDQDLLTDDLETLLEEKNGYHFIFVATGDDNQNYQLALRVRRHYLRHPLTWGYPDIRTVIWDDAMTAIVADENNIALRGSTIPKGKARYTDYALMLDDKEESELYNSKCSVMLMGSMSETIRTVSALQYDALRYHTYYCLPDKHKTSAYINKHGIPQNAYYQYYASSESDKLSNWALAIHGRIKDQWYRWYAKRYPEVSKDAILAMLAENEHIRWCIFKLLEGDAAVPNERITDYLAGNPKGRDDDPIRGFHVTLRPWDDLAARAEYDPAGREFWQRMQDNNLAFVSFALDLEAS